MKTDQMSEIKVLQKIAESLNASLRKSEDIRLVPYYAEYFLAYALSVEGSELGYDVEVLKKRQGADLVVRNVSRNIHRRIEVKTGHTDREGLACTASFSMGKSIEKAEFDYCVFVVFENLAVKECLVFTLDELKEVAEKKRPYPITIFPNNQCCLFWYGNLVEYERAFPNNEDRLGIEIRLHEHPEDFKNRWDKIFS